LPWADAFFVLTLSSWLLLEEFPRWARLFFLFPASGEFRGPDRDLFRLPVFPRMREVPPPSSPDLLF